MLQQNSRHIALLVACLLVICGPVAFAGWLRLEVHPAVDLGTIDADAFNPATGTWTPLTSTLRSAYVIANTGFTLTVTAESTAGFMPADLARFKMIGGDLTTFTTIPEAGLILATSDTGAFLKITNIQYQYVPCWRDAPGEYAGTVTYTVTAR